MLISRTMEVPGSTLGHNAHLTARRPAILRLVASRHDLHFLGGIYARDTDDRAAPASADRRSTVKCDQRILGARSMNLIGNSATNGKVEITKRRTAAYAGKHL